MKPVRNNVLVRRLQSSKETESGIILKSSLEPDRAVVEQIGTDVTEVSPGEEVMLNWNKAVDVGSDLFIISQDEIIMAFV